MEVPGLQLTLIPAPDEPTPENLERLQRELALLPVRVNSSYLLREILQGGAAAFGYGITTNLIPGAVSAVQLALALGPTIGAALGAWIHARYGRKVRIKVGDIEAEAQTPEELERLLDKAQEILKRNEPKRILP